MPTYQYVCTECGGQLEAVQRFTDEPLTVHEDCGGRLRKVFSPVGIVFKGSGFYKTDSRSSASSGASAAASGTSKDSESRGGESKSSESKSGESKGGESKSKSGSDAAPASSSATSAATSSSGSKSSTGEKVA